MAQGLCETKVQVSETKVQVQALMLSRPLTCKRQNVAFGDVVLRDSGDLSDRWRICDASPTPSHSNGRGGGPVRRWSADHRTRRPGGRLQTGRSPGQGPGRPGHHPHPAVRQEPVRPDHDHAHRHPGHRGDSRRADPRRGDGGPAQGRCTAGRPRHAAGPQRAQRPHRRRRRTGRPHARRAVRAARRRIRPRHRGGPHRPRRQGHHRDLLRRADPAPDPAAASAPGSPRRRNRGARLARHRTARRHRGLLRHPVVPRGPPGPARLLRRAQDEHLRVLAQG